MLISISESGSDSSACASAARRFRGTDVFSGPPKAWGCVGPMSRGFRGRNFKAPSLGYCHVRATLIVFNFLICSLNAGFYERNFSVH